jgi:Helix-turn-helix domain of resolvase/Resolvase, N terminal domain
LRSGNAGFTKSRRVIGEHVSHPLVGWRSSDQDGWGLRSNLICRGIFEDFHAGSKGNLYSKIETPLLFAALAEFERNLIGERTRAGLDAARARGRKGGRPEALDAEKRKLLIDLYEQKKTPVNTLCKMMGISKPTLYSYIKKENN